MPPIPFWLVMSLLCLLLFFTRRRRPPISTLFPTRRSSDLYFAITFLTMNNFLISYYEVQLEAGDRARALARSEEHTSNSSHRCISYAVFCLKKKQTLCASRLSARPCGGGNGGPRPLGNASG